MADTGVPKSLLFAPLEMRGLRLRNRIVMPPMCQWLSDDTAMVKDYHLSHYVQRAVGGTGLILVEATAVQPNGRITATDLGIWDEAHMPGLGRLASGIQEHGAIPGIQLAHAGRKAWPEFAHTVAPSPIRFSEQYPEPAELSRNHIEAVSEAFVNAALRAERAGFQLIEIHAAHGYLLHQFLSPLSNKREDEFGGDFESRLRFPLSVVQSVREAVSENMLVGLRVSASEYDPAGYTQAELVRICGAFQSAGADFIHASSGGATPKGVEQWPGYQLGLAKQIKKAVAVPVIGVGRLESGALAEFALRMGYCDLVAVGRQMLRDPMWACTAAAELKEPTPVIDALKPVFEYRR